MSTAFDEGSAPTVVLVHGAFADASGWNGVIRELDQRGYQSRAVANPLRGLAADAAYVASVVRAISGPVLLVGHSYGGAVITNAARDAANVKALVYAAAFAPDKGESSASIGTRFGDDLATHLDVHQYPRPDGSTGEEFSIKVDRFHKIFAADVPAREAAVMAATQRPLAELGIIGQSGDPAWRRLPSWYQVSAYDRTIPPAAQRFMAERMRARTIELKSSHASIVSEPRAIADLIVRAAGQR